jgi:hypothetical protein
MAQGAGAQHLREAGEQVVAPGDRVAAIKGIPSEGRAQAQGRCRAAGPKTKTPIAVRGLCPAAERGAIAVKQVLSPAVRHCLTGEVGSRLCEQVRFLTEWSKVEHLL